MAEPISIAVVITVLNEANTLPALLDSLAAQTRSAAAIVLVDGGSTDESLRVAAGYERILPGLQLLSAPGSNIATGRNTGIAVVKQSIIAVTDGGCTVAPDWLAELVRPIEAAAADLAVAQVIPAPANHKEACIGTCSLTHRTKIGGEWLHTHGRGLAFRRELWVALGGFPTAYDRCEDTAFIMAAAAAGWRLRSAPAARVYWRPRPHYRTVMRQYYLYARDLARAGFSRHFHLKTMAQGSGALILLLWSALWPGPLPWLLLFLLSAAYLWRKAQAGCFAVPGRRTYYRVPLVLAAILIGTLAGIGAGQWQRLRAKQSA